MKNLARTIIKKDLNRLKKSFDLDQDNCLKIDNCIEILDTVDLPDTVDDTVAIDPVAISITDMEGNELESPFYFVSIQSESVDRFFYISDDEADITEEVVNNILEDYYEKY